MFTTPTTVCCCGMAGAPLQLPGKSVDLAGFWRMLDEHEGPPDDSAAHAAASSIQAAWRQRYARGLRTAASEPEPRQGKVSPPQVDQSGHPLPGESTEAKKEPTPSWHTLQPAVARLQLTTPPTQHTQNGAVPCVKRVAAPSTSWTLVRIVRL